MQLWKMLKRKKMWSINSVLPQATVLLRHCGWLCSWEVEECNLQQHTDVMAKAHIPALHSIIYKPPQSRSSIEIISESIPGISVATLQQEWNSSRVRNMTPVLHILSRVLITDTSAGLDFTGYEASKTTNIKRKSTWNGGKLLEISENESMFDNIVPPWGSCENKILLLTTWA